jgi:F-type H+-transporting ATPase subunit b
MNRNMKGSARIVTVAGLMLGTVLSLPTVALAESPSGPDLLLPKPAEFIPALIAFLVIWLIMAKLAWPSILGMMETRQQKIQDDLDSAEKSKAKAAAEAQSYEDKLVEANQKADEIISAAKKEAEEERSQILAKAQHEASDIIAKAHGAVDSERRKATIELSSSVVDLSVEIASKIIGNDLTEDQQRRLAEKYLAEVSAPDEH